MDAVKQKALTTEFFESYQATFPDSNPLFVLPLMFSIDVKTWKFPEVFHSGPIAPQIEFIENSEVLRKLMQNNSLTEMEKQDKALEN